MKRIIYFYVNICGDSFGVYATTYDKKMTLEENLQAIRNSFTAVFGIPSSEIHITKYKIRKEKERFRIFFDFNDYKETNKWE